MTQSQNHDSLLVRVWENDTDEEVGKENEPEKSPQMLFTH